MAAAGAKPARMLQGVKLHVGARLDGHAAMSHAIQQAAAGRLAVASGEVEPVDLAVQAPWFALWLESDFMYIAHRDICAEMKAPAAASSAAGPASGDSSGTRFPLLALVVEADAVDAVASAIPRAVTRINQNSEATFAKSRLLLLVVGKKPASCRSAAAAAFATNLVNCSVAAVELTDVVHAAEYVVQCASSIAESRKRRVPSRFKVLAVLPIPGSRCQTLPAGPDDKVRIAWVSMLMQIPGVSEEVAKVIADKYCEMRRRR
eukprot:TRINITY_DN11012_c0_g1_i8.p1 TRINITY_DN11012_c0_g1~~TRINITY_DN11012_c0_g1_i8.p1  ORF type:complete len:262 (-),score=46.44 TRINITY_DN11012_c0_g1_i8:267-1052(-)